MLNSVRLLLLSAATVFSSLSVLAQDEPVIKVNPVGEPKSLTRGNAVRYLVWYDAEGWHLRTDSGGKPHVFNGSINVVGGKVIAINQFENMEAAPKKKKRADLGVLNKAKNQITFKFTTSKKRDGFDFQLDESAKEIQLKLLIDGKPMPDRILIGPASQPAPAEVLLLPAHPE
jgi:hypothetical protein